MKGMVLGLAFALGAAALFAQEAVILEIRGTVEVKAPGAAAWSPAEQGQAIGKNAMISTGFKSGAVVAIGNSTLSVQPLSRLSVEELVLMERGEKVGVNLRAGRIRAEVKPPAGGKTEFTIRSPSVTASVRGTAFEFDGVELRVEEGRVHVAGGDGGGIYVGAGHAVKTDIESGLTAGVAQAAREELTPPAPAGAGAAEAPASAVLAGDIDAGFEWK